MPARTGCRASHVQNRRVVQNRALVFDERHHVGEHRRRIACIHAQVRPRTGLARRNAEFDRPGQGVPAIPSPWSQAPPSPCAEVQADTFHEDRGASDVCHLDLGQLHIDARRPGDGALVWPITPPCIRAEEQPAFLVEESRPESNLKSRTRESVEGHLPKEPGDRNGDPNDRHQKSNGCLVHPASLTVAGCSSVDRAKRLDRPLPASLP